MKSLTTTLPLLAILAITGCVTSTSPDVAQERAAAELLKQAERKTSPVETRAGLYLESAAKAGGRAISGKTGEEDRRIYNKAAADGTTYHLRFAKGSSDGVWDPAYFNSFTPAADVELKTIKNRNRQDGIGGALVGVHKTDPLELFSPLAGVTAPVTALLDFKGNDVTLTLVDPTEKPKTRIAGKERMLDADFSAPLAFYPQKSELWQGLMGALRVSDHMKTTGLYMLQPYDRERIPLIFVHGLISTPRMWRNVINEIEMDPALRARYQCWVFSYPTGNPPLYSAMRLREELAKIQQRYPDSKDMVLVGHSMGGILSRTQVTTVDRNAWDVIGKDKASRFFANVSRGGLVERCTLFQANPHDDRAILICTPHRGSEMAIGTLGELAIKLISLPADIVSSAASTVGGSISMVTGDANRMPTSIDGLSPRNPTLKVLDSRPMTVPYHTILGDSGKGDSPNSTDGVVKYWSSHLTAAKSEKIVPGPHGACELPETITELRRILYLHLKEAGRTSHSPNKQPNKPWN